MVQLEQQLLKFWVFVLQKFVELVTLEVVDTVDCNYDDVYYNDFRIVYYCYTDLVDHYYCNGYILGFDNCFAVHYYYCYCYIYFYVADFLDFGYNFDNFDFLLVDSFYFVDFYDLFVLLIDLSWRFVD